MSPRLKSRLEATSEIEAGRVNLREIFAKPNRYGGL